MGGNFGKPDKYATNDVLNGQIVATGTPGAQTVADPNQGLTEKQKRNDQLLLQGGKMINSIATAKQEESQQGQPTQINFADNQPQVQLPFYGAMRRYGQ